MSESKEEILANFQSITGIDDVGEAFAHLEDTNWDLMTAINRVIPQDDDSIGNMANIPSPSIISNISNISSGSSSTSNNHLSHNNLLNNFSNSNHASTSSNSFIRSNNIASESAFVPVASTSADAEIVDLTSDIDLDPTRHNNSNRTLTFNIHFNQQMYTIRLSATSTVEQLKSKISDATKVPLCRQALRGWPPAKQSEAQNIKSQLCDLDLSAENELILVDLTDEGFMDTENDEVSQRLDKVFTLTIVEQPSGRALTLNLNGRTTIQEVKTDVYYISDIPVRHQEWTGWPSGCDNDTNLAQSGIELSHNFILRNIARKVQNNSNALSNNTTLNIETDSSTDEFEDASDFNTCEEFFTDSPPVLPPSRHLIPNNTDNEITGSTKFVENYVQRYGDPHPVFYIGSLENALKEACNKPARERKLLAIYLHHGESILTNVFCDHLMKHESIIHTFAENFVLYGWDLTYENNKDMLLSSVTACISNTASLTVRNIPLDKLPAVLIIGKSRLSGRTSFEVLSVIHGNVGLDDLLTRLIEAGEMYTEQLQVEIREEDERAARDQVKAEQDMAYEEALQADMAKDALKRQKEAAIAAERQRLESEKAEEDARRESIRIVAEQSLPHEPAETEAGTSKIRVRKPTGDFLERRFYIRNTLQDLLNYVASNGFLIDEYKLISSWPRRDLTAISAEQTLESLKLYPQETVILEER